MQGWTRPTSAMHGWVRIPRRNLAPWCRFARRVSAVGKARRRGFVDANLDGAEGLTQGQLNRAHCDSGTKLPAGLTGVEDAKR